MTWPAFLKKLTSTPSLDIIGPFGDKWSPGPRPALFIDSGVQWRRPLDFSAAVGDGDSGSPMDLLLEREKDFSDFAYALRSMPQNIVEVYLHGFLGGRRDHEMANFGEVHAFLKARLKPSFVRWDDAIISWSAGQWNVDWNGSFSLLALEPAEVQIEGACDYQLTQPMNLPSLSSFGLSNVGHGLIRVQTSAPLFCFLNG